MVIELSGVHFGLKSQVWFQTKIAQHKVNTFEMVKFSRSDTGSLSGTNILVIQL